MKMTALFLPEGCRWGTPENQDLISSLDGLEYAMTENLTLEGMVTLCDSALNLHIDLGCATGIIPPEEAIYCRPGEERKDIALITRVGKPIAVKILSVKTENGETTVELSRRAAQKECLKHLLHLTPGDIIPAKVTHLEPFGAFVDIGCGVSSLLSVDCISVSRISHPADRLRPGMPILAAVKSIDPDTSRIYMTLRELLGTWEENVAGFEAGQTVTGIIRSVENYGVFIELAPNLAGLAEIRDIGIDELRQKIGHTAAVYIKAIVPDRMKIKLVLIDICEKDSPSYHLNYFIDPSSTPHLSHWLYSPEGCRKTVETRFDLPI